MSARADLPRIQARMPQGSVLMAIESSSPDCVRASTEQVVMLRNAKRPLAGCAGRGEPELLMGRYTEGEYDRFVWEDGEKRDIGNMPAVSVNLNGGRSGTRTFTDPGEMVKFAADIVEAAAWLAEQRAAIE